MNVFFISYFSYHRVMCSRTNNRKKKTSFMKRCLKILYNGEQSIVVLLFEFFRPIIKTVYHETEAISYFAPKILDIPLEKLRNIENLENSRTKIKTLFFNWYCGAPRPMLDQFRWGSLTNPMLITAFGYWFQPECHLSCLYFIFYLQI